MKFTATLSEPDLFRVGIRELRNFRELESSPQKERL
jgi:hypothetical protein